MAQNRGNSETVRYVPRYRENSGNNPVDRDFPSTAKWPAYMGFKALIIFTVDA